MAIRHYLSLPVNFDKLPLWKTEKKKKKKSSIVYSGLPSLKKYVVTIHDLNKALEIIRIRLLWENSGCLN